MLEVRNLTKHYGSKTAVNNVSFTVPNGRVTGFLGPNGAGKSTTMRMMVGLEKPSQGTALVDGQPYRGLTSPITAVGALLDAKALHPRRSAVAHLRSLALTHGIPKARVDQVIEMTGLSAVSHKKVRGFSLGMGQRVGIAAALLGDPQNLILDEPVNGLDPEGVIWVRNLARNLAADGRAVLISSHLMGEMSQTADDLVIIGRGRLLTHCSVEDFLKSGSQKQVLVRADEREALARALNQAGYSFTPVETDGLLVEQGEPRNLARLAQEQGLLLHEITPQKSSLEQAYINMTRDDVEYVSTHLQEPTQPPAPPAPGQAATLAPWNSTPAQED